MSESVKGAIYALIAYFIWGLIPIYFSMIMIIPPAEILAHRIIWSMVFLLGLITYTQKWPLLLVFVKVWSNLRWLIISSLAIAMNWLTYIWALQNNQVMETSLGYYINPMVSVFLGMLFLGERLRPMQAVAVAIAGLGVMHEIFVAGRLPAVALILAASFGLYGLVRKKVGVDSIVGLLVETAMLLPVALAYWVYLVFQQESTLGNSSIEIDALILGLGLLTALPLLFFGFAALRMPLTTLGFYQYLAPTMVLVLAITMYGEPFTQSRAITFGLIFVAIVVFSAEALIVQHKRKRLPD